MKKFLSVAIVAFLAFQVVSAKPKAKTAAAAGDHTQLNELAENVQKLVTNATDAIQANLPDSKTVVDTITNTARNISSNLETTIEHLNKAVKDHEGDIQDVLKGVSEKLSEARDNIKKAIGPEGQKKVAEFKEKFEKGLKEASAQGEKLANAIKPQANKLQEDLNVLTKSFLDNLLEQTKSLKQIVEGAKTN